MKQGRVSVRIMLKSASAWTVLVIGLLLRAECTSWDSIYGKLIYANVIFRHGIRTPSQIHPNDPNIDDTAELWPHGLGELTKEGAFQQYRLGKWLRKRYEHLLPQDGRYNHSAIEVLSSDVDRCIMSATANMAGMFPNEVNENLGGLVWPPVPVHTIPKEYDNVIRLSRPCKKFKVELDKFKSTIVYQKIMEPFHELISFCSFVSGFNITVQDPRQLGTLYITLLIEDMYGLEVPVEWRAYYPNKMSEAVGIIFSIPAYTISLARLRVGYLLNRILTSMENKLSNSLDPPTQNISIYSGHDSTLAALLHAMGVYNYLLPPFASTVLIELRKKPDHYPVVMVFYKNSTTNQQLFLLKLPSCGEACPLHHLRDLWSPLVIADVSKWEAECENN